MSHWPKDLYKPFKRVTTAGKHIPAFDGLRCFAILWVAFYHLNGSFSHKAPLGEWVPDEGVLHTILTHGRQGVPLFFTLSGFFLCLPFARHYLQGTNAIELRTYYVRRFIRIVPPYWIAVLTITVIYAVMGRYSLEYLVSHAAASLGFVHTFIFEEINVLNSVFWALEVEMQFYLIAPLMAYLYFLMGPVARMATTMLLIGLLPFLQAAYERSIAFTLLDFLQYFLAGFAIADVYVSNEGLRFKHGLIPLVALPVILFATYDDSIIERIIYPFMIISLYLVVLFNPFWEKVFSRKSMVTIGGISYSVFLIHFPIIGFLGTYTMPIPLTGTYYVDFLTQCVIILPAILVLSFIFYLAAERPFMLIRPGNRARSVENAGPPEKTRTDSDDAGTGSDVMNIAK